MQDQCPPKSEAEPQREITLLWVTSGSLLGRLLRWMFGLKCNHMAVYWDGLVYDIDIFHPSHWELAEEYFKTRRCVRHCTLDFPLPVSELRGACPVHRRFDVPGTVWQYVTPSKPVARNCMSAVRDVLRRLNVHTEAKNPDRLWQELRSVVRPDGIPRGCLGRGAGPTAQWHPRAG